jgi:hypothetical protein
MHSPAPHFHRQHDGERDTQHRVQRHDRCLWGAKIVTLGEIGAQQHEPYEQQQHDLHPRYAQRLNAGGLVKIF